MGKWKSILTLPHIFHKKVLLARFGKKDGRNFDRLVWVDYGYWTEDEDGKEYLFDGGEYSSLSDFGPTHWSEFPEFSEDSMTTQCEKAFEEFNKNHPYYFDGPNQARAGWVAACKWRQSFDAKICENIKEEKHNAYKLSSSSPYEDPSEYLADASDGAGDCAEAIRKGD